MNIEIVPERKLKYLREYMSLVIDLWPKKPKPFERWLESTLDLKYNKGKKQHEEKKKLVCRYCRRQFDEYAEKTRDHIVPLSRGGYNHKENRVPCCKECNQWKGDKELTDWLKEVKILVKKEKERKPYTFAQLGLIIGAIKQLIDQIKKDGKKVSLYKV